MKPSKATAKGDGEVAVVAHAGKTLGGGLAELRAVLARAGHRAPLWREVTKSRQAPKAVRHVIKKGAKLVFVWGGDGMVQHCAGELAGSGVAMAIVPAGTANLLARHLEIPADVAKAVAIGLRGERRSLDVGVLNGEQFVVMAGMGFDALTVGAVSAKQKARLGRLNYVRSGLRAMRIEPVRMKVRVDGAMWFKGDASCLLLGNVGTITGGLELLPDASPRDGLLDVGVATADGVWQWLRVFARVARGDVRRSPFVRTTQGRKIVVELGRETPFELDGGARAPAERFVAHVQAGALEVCVRKTRSTARRGRPRLRIPSP